MVVVVVVGVGDDDGGSYDGIDGNGGWLM